MIQLNMFQTVFLNNSTFHPIKTTTTTKNKKQFSSIQS